MDWSNPAFSGTAIDEKGRRLKLNYFVTEGKCLTDGAPQVPVFGITVNMEIDGNIVDSSSICDVSPSLETVMRMTELFAQNSVTPITLKDVVEDCIALQL
jgi:hypothetical protein